MNKEIKSIVKKTVKIAGVTCIAAGAVALVTSGAALKALIEGGKFLKDTVVKIAGEGSEVKTADAETAPAEAVEAPAAETVAEEENFEGAEARNA